MKTLALAIAGLLAAPLALANCDTELAKIEQRVKDAGMDPQNEQVLVDWLAQQRVENASTGAAQCTALAAEIERQMEQKGYFAAAASLERNEDVATTPEPGAPQGADIAVAAAPAEVNVQQPAADVDVRQQPAEVQVQMEPAQVLVQVPEPRVQVTQPPPQVTVHQPDPKVRVEQQEPQVSVDQAEPKVSVTQGEPEVEVQQGEPQVAVEQSPPIVDVERGDTALEVQQADGGNVAIGAATGTSGLAASDSGTGQDYADASGQPLDAGGFEQDSGAAMAGTEPQADGEPEAIWQRDEARNGLDGQADAFAATPREVAVSELLGDIVVDADGQRVGRVVEALTEAGGGAVFLRVDVAASRGLDSEELVLPVEEVEADAGQLRLRGDAGQVLAAAAQRSIDGLHPAEGETVQLAGEW